MWRYVAALELRKVQLRWHILSIRQLSKKLHVSRNTLRKLSLENPDKSFRLETLDKVYNTFIVLCPFHFAVEEQEAEIRFLIESRMRILCYVKVHPDIQKMVEEERLHGEYQSPSAWIFSGKYARE